MTVEENRCAAAEGAAITLGSTVAPRVMSAAEREQLRHPMERRIVTVVALLEAFLIVIVLGLLIGGAEWLAARPTIAKYKTHARILLVAVLAAPLVMTYALRRRRLLAQEESICLGTAQLPEIHSVLVRHCLRAGIPVPDLYLSDGVDHTTSFEWRGQSCIVLSTHDFDLFPCAADDMIDFALAREVGSISLGHTRVRQELLSSFVAPIPFLRGPLHEIRTYSRDRYGAVLAPRALRALMVTASGDRLLNRIDVDAYFAQLDQGAEGGVWNSIIWLIRKRVPLAHRVEQLRRAGLLNRA